MYDKIKEEISQDYYQQYFPNEGQRFVAWYLRNIHLRDMTEARFDLTDGQDDKQIDAIVVDDDNNTIYVIQGKFIGQGSVDAEPLREVLSSWVQLKDIVRLQDNCNERLKKKLSEVALALEDDYDIVFELITTGSLTNRDFIPACRLSIFAGTLQSRQNESVSSQKFILPVAMVSIS